MCTHWAGEKTPHHSSTDLTDQTYNIHYHRAHKVWSYVTVFHYGTSTFSLGPQSVTSIESTQFAWNITLMNIFYSLRCAILGAEGLSLETVKIRLAVKCYFNKYLKSLSVCSSGRQRHQFQRCTVAALIMINHLIILNGSKCDFICK